MITFKWTSIAHNEAVCCEKKLAGNIKKVKGGWQYFPKGSKNGGEVFKGINACEDSLKEGVLTDQY